ncbi:MAG: hypothetical protein LBP50_01605, partial [Tannerella sp.]|nr:hypothetical protein [Tannerella sp.]
SAVCVLLPIPVFCACEVRRYWHHCKNEWLRFLLQRLFRNARKLWVISIYLLPIFTNKKAVNFWFTAFYLFLLLAL